MKKIFLITFISLLTLQAGFSQKFLSPVISTVSAGDTLLLKLLTKKVSIETDKDEFDFNKDVYIKAQKVLSPTEISNLIASNKDTMTSYLDGWSGTADEGDAPSIFNGYNMPIRTVVNVESSLSRNLWLPTYSNRKYLTVVAKSSMTTSPLVIQQLPSYAQITTVNVGDSVQLEYVPTTAKTGLWKVYSPGFMTLSTVQSATALKYFNAGISSPLLGSTSYETERFGYHAAYAANTSCRQSTAVGAFAAAVTTSGRNWTAIGMSSAQSNTTGSYWTAIGAGAGENNKTGSNWIAIGYEAGAYTSINDSLNTTLNNSIYIGNYTRSQYKSRTNEIVIGDQAYGFGSNTVSLGNSSISGLWLGGKKLVDGNQNFIANSVLINGDTAVTKSQITKEFIKLQFNNSSTANKNWNFTTSDSICNLYLVSKSSGFSIAGDSIVFPSKTTKYKVFATISFNSSSSTSRPYIITLEYTSGTDILKYTDTSASGSQTNPFKTSFYSGMVSVPAGAHARIVRSSNTSCIFYLQPNTFIQELNIQEE